MAKLTESELTQYFDLSAHRKTDTLRPDHGESSCLTAKLTEIVKILGNAGIHTDPADLLDAIDQES